MVPDIKTQVDKEQAEQYLREITRGWDSLPEDPIIELRCLFPQKTPNISHYSPDDIGISLLIDHAFAMNAHGLNAYPIVNPVRASAVRGNISATDDDILAAYFFWADADDEAATYAIRNFAGPKYTMAVTTGRTPFPRPHIYWRIQDGPTTDLEAWTRIQKGIAAQLSTDKSVVNPSRIMRLPGTVNWPTKEKAEKKGRIPEIATLKTKYDDDRGPVPYERMERVFGGVLTRTHDVSGFEIDTAPATLDRALAAANIAAGKDWRENVKSLVASYVARGWTDDEILVRCSAFTLPGWTDEETKDDVLAFIKWTREQEAVNGGRYAESPKPQDTIAQEITPEEAKKIEPFPFRPWVRKSLEDIPYPEFIYSDFYARGYTSVTLAAPKVGKSMLGLAEAIDMATGRGFLSGVKRDPLKVVYFNAEDDQNVIDARVSALLEHYNIDQDEIIGQLYPTSGVELDNFYLSSGQEGVINEALFVSIEKFITEQDADAIIFDPLQDLTRSPETNEVFRLLGQRLRRMSSTCGIALGLIHHTRKVAPGLTPTIDDMRGGSALRGTARFNRILVNMTEDEAVKARVENHRHYFRIGDMESNLAPPSADVNRWYEKVSVLAPNGQHIGAVTPWQWPDAFDGVSVEQARHVQRAVMAADPRPRESIQAKGWVGNIIGNIIGVDITDKSQRARVNTIVKKWIETDVLAVEYIFDRQKGREMPVVVAGKNTLSDGE